MQIPKILIVIEHEPSDKAEDGTITPGYVTAAYSNLPSRYLDIVVREAEVTDRDDDGAVVGWRCDTTHPRGEVPFEVAIEPAFYNGGDEPPAPRNDGVEEWRVLFWLGDDVKWALVLKAPNVFVAAERVMQEFPLWSDSSRRRADRRAPHEHAGCE